MNARKCVHAQKPYPSQALRMNQARSEEEEKERQIDREPGVVKLAEKVTNFDMVRNDLHI